MIILNKQKNLSTETSSLHLYLDTSFEIWKSVSLNRLNSVVYEKECAFVFGGSPSSCYMHSYHTCHIIYHIISYHIRSYIISDQIRSYINLCSIVWRTVCRTHWYVYVIGALRQYNKSDKTYQAVIINNELKS
jgi:hypothetical protein